MSYELMYDFEKLYEAYKKCRGGKMQKTEVIQFELNLSEELVRLKQELETKTYHLGNYYHFTIYDPKKREIQALPFRDRIVQHNLCDNILEPLLEHYLIYDNSACRKGKGTHFAISQWFALYYLDGLDRLVKEKYRIKYYTRYMERLYHNM